MAAQGSSTLTMMRTYAVLRALLALGCATLALVLWLTLAQAGRDGRSPSETEPLPLRKASSLSIHDLQGAAHLSPYKDQMVSGVKGMITAVRSNGFYMQEPLPDANPATSEGIFVYAGTRLSLLAGDLVSVTGKVEEVYPFSLSPGGLSITRLSLAPPVTEGVTILSRGNALPAATLLGSAGRLPPDQVIEDDAQDGNVEISGVFDPALDGIDFFESLEGMLISVKDGRIIEGTTQDGVIAVVGEGGAFASLNSPRGALVIRPSDFNPERILIEDVLIPSEPRVRVGQIFPGVITGVLDYSMGNFKLYNIAPLPTPTLSGVISETARAPLPEELSLATFNMQNLDPTDSSAKFSALARQIVHYLQAPDLLVLQEIQDNNGKQNDAVITATLTYAALINAIQKAGGPIYQARDIPPLDDQDGGEAGGNIRSAFLFRSDRGLSFVDRPGGDATTAVTATLETTGLELSLSPGRIDPSNPAFQDSRKPLVGEFLFNGHKLFVIANHFNSRTGDSPLFGRYQPPRLTSETKRLQQAVVVNAFVRHLLALEANANVVVLGDLNDFPFSASLAALKGGQLTNLLDRLPPEEHYTYIFDGNAQALDHILVSPHLARYAMAQIDVVHLNAEFPAAARPSDHDPVLARLFLPAGAGPWMVYLPTILSLSGQ